MTDRFERLHRHDHARAVNKSFATVGATVQTDDRAGKRTLAESFVAGPGDPTREHAFQVSRARAQLVALSAATKSGNVELSVLAASEVKLCIHYARCAAVEASTAALESADAMHSSADDLEHEAQPLLAAVVRLRAVPRSSPGAEDPDIHEDTMATPAGYKIAS